MYPLIIVALQNIAIFRYLLILKTCLGKYANEVEEIASKADKTGETGRNHKLNLSNQLQCKMVYF